MTREHRGRSTAGRSTLAEALPAQPEAQVGKRTLVEQAYPQVRRLADAAVAVGTPTSVQPIQVEIGSQQHEPNLPVEVAALARHGFTGPAQPLPFLDRIQAVFGRHDLSSVRAHVGGRAAEAAGHMGAQAYTMGSSVAFGHTPDLYTAAHEAAHVVQQRSCTVPDGLGHADDPYERAADTVAERVVRGQDAADLLGPAHSPSSAALGAVQRVMIAVPNGRPLGKQVVEARIKEAGLTEAGAAFVRKRVKHKKTYNIDNTIRSAVAKFGTEDQMRPARDDGAMQAMGNEADAGGVAVVDEGAGSEVPSASPSIQSRPSQSAVGFEFQTLWQLEHKEDNDSWQPVGQADGEVFKDSTGLLEADPRRPERDGKCNFVIEGDAGDVEFITPPFTEEARIELAAVSMRTFADAVSIMMRGRDYVTFDAISAKFRERIVERRDPRDERHKLTPAAACTAAEPDKFRITKKNFSDKGARPQATISSPLDEFATTMERFDIGKALLDENSRPNPNFGIAAVRARRAVAGLSKDQNWDRLGSLLAVVLHYLWNPMVLFDTDKEKEKKKGYDNPGYAKKHLSLMLRNDFASLYRALTGHEKKQFSVDWVLQIAGLDGEAPVFPRGFQDQGVGQIYFGPSRRQWLASIIKPESGNEHARVGDKRVLKQNPWLKQGALNRLDLMSRGDVRSSSAAMGAYALEDDRLIAEWRTLEPADVHVRRWGDLMKEVLRRATHPAPLAGVQPLCENPVRRILSREAISDLKLRRLDDTVIKDVSELSPLDKVYLDREGTPWRLIDVAPSYLRAQPVEKGNPYGDFYKEHIAPNYRFTFEVLTEFDRAELPISEREALREKGDENS